MEHPPLPADNSNVLFVANMNPRISKRKLRAMVEPFGTVKTLDMVKVHAIGYSSAFAVVEMTEETTATRAIAELDGTSIDGRCIRVRHGF